MAGFPRAASACSSFRPRAEASEVRRLSDIADRQFACRSAICRPKPTSSQTGPRSTRWCTWPYRNCRTKTCGWLKDLQSTWNPSRERKLKTIDATCPLVTKVHLEAIRFARDGYHIILIGHEGHDEVIGTMGEAPESITLVDSPAEVDRLPFAADAKLAYLTQTTLSVVEASAVIERLKQRYPGIVSPPKEDICYATTNRQEAVAVLAKGADAVIVLGSQNSSNSQRLREIGQALCGRAYLVDGIHELPLDEFHGDETVVITAGASAPEVVVEECLDTLVKRFHATVEHPVVREEHVYFPLPKELRALQAAT